MDIPQGLALAFLALIAVLPEYAVGLYFAWTAAKRPEYEAYVAANMTGANRLLVGLGWSLVTLVHTFRAKVPAVVLEEEHRTEIMMLVPACLYAFVIPLKGSIALTETAILCTIFVLYILACYRAEVHEPHLVGPARAIGSLQTRNRRLVTVFMFLFAAVAIVSCAERFAEALVETGHVLNVDEFILVQWLAPLASEAPEILIALIFTLGGRETAAIGALISSKVNQWSFLVGCLPVAYSMSGGRPGSIPLNARQIQEVLLTSCESVFDVAILAKLRLSRWNGLLILGLWSTSVIFTNTLVRYGYSAVYLVLAAFFLIADGERRRGILALGSHAIGKVRNSPPNS